MCDYSLTGIPNRLAAEGEALVIRRFRTGSVGLASPCAFASGWWSIKQSPAVCIPPGARLRLHDIPGPVRKQCNVGMTEEVTFVQLSATEYQFRDAVRFNNGREILLQMLKEGMRVDVLSLSSGDHEHEIHRRLEEEYQRVFL
jgi:hypothetical protein